MNAVRLRGSALSGLPAGASSQPRRGATFLHRLAARGQLLGGRVYAHMDLCVCALSPDEVEPNQPDALSIVRQPDFMTDLALRTCVEESQAWSPSEMTRRAELGDTCYLVRDGDRCVHYSWLTNRRRSITYIGYEATLDDNNYWIYDCYTSPTHRGLSIYPYVLQRIVGELKAGASSRVWIDVQPSNQASVKGVSRAGFVEVARLEKWVLFSVLVLRRRKRIVNAILGKHLDHIRSRWMPA